MRISSTYWNRAALAAVGLIAITISGCQTGGFSWPTASWSKWGNSPSTSALASSKPSNLPPPPSTNFTPTQSPTTAVAGTGLANAGGYGQAYPTTAASAIPYGTQQASSLQPSGYQNSPYGVHTASTQPQTGGYSNQPTGATPGAATNTAWPQSSPYSSPTSAPQGYANDAYRTADQRNSYGNTAPAAGPGSWNTTVSPSAGSYGTPSNGYGASAPSGYGGATSGGYGSQNNSGASTTNAPTGVVQNPTTPANAFATAPAAINPAPTGNSYGNDPLIIAPRSIESNSGGYSAISPALPASPNVLRSDGGYRPGSTSRAQPIESSLRADPSNNVQPAGFSGGNYNAPPQDTTGFRGSNENSYSPPSSGYQP